LDDLRSRKSRYGRMFPRICCVFRTFALVLLSGVATIVLICLFSVVNFSLV
jgi:hypothetical protein